MKIDKICNFCMQFVQIIGLAFAPTAIVQIGRLIKGALAK